MEQIVTNGKKNIAFAFKGFSMYCKMLHWHTTHIEATRQTGINSQLTIKQ